MDDQRVDRASSGGMRFSHHASLVLLLFLLLAGCNHRPPLDDAEIIQVNIWPEKIKCTLSIEQTAKFKSVFAHPVKDTSLKKWEVFGDINYRAGGVDHKGHLFTIGEDVGIEIDSGDIWRGASMEEMLDIARECSKQQQDAPPQK